ncbi:MAG: hypothetical protein ACE5PV_26280 [Candidatus Poribacteria bacterium]
MIKEVEWAKQFHVDDHFGTPDDDFGAQVLNLPVAQHLVDHYKK